MKNLYPKVQAIMAAALFGASAPLAKILLGKIDPILLAALLYIGCGFGLLFIHIFKVITKKIEKEASLESKDFSWLVGAILSGGVVAPIILMISLKSTPAATASLLLNFESVATTVIAAIVFKEALGKRIWIAVGLITFASIILTWDSSGKWGLSLGALGVIIACALWGIDNNFTRNISAKNPVIIVTMKGIIAGFVSLIIAFLSGNTIPELKVIVAALILGFFSYGISIILFIFAMRNLGAARTSAFFGSAPFIGTIISLFLFQEISEMNFIFSIPIMIVGAVLILWEEHAHKHKHEKTEHNHRHFHNDNHHNHNHENFNKIDEYLVCEHAHFHIHEDIEHEHAHTPDIHHRHIH